MIFYMAAVKKTTEKLPVWFNATIGRDEKKMLVTHKYSYPQWLDHLSVEKLPVHYKFVDGFDNIFRLAVRME